MTREQWIHGISKDELAFRLYGKDFFQRTCLDCVYFRPCRDGSWECGSEEYRPQCERQYREWLEEEME